ncbi:hypothetical protein EPI10_022947 [Gossypium australe]|uniref:Uncharacterized protein n=1 Tax=Gossypium australe TaxID=47621 RepID=A0A5B6VSR6_9ROSI|nr:hypothetical protein EPI10_022947 [Gossypium australe]
MWRIANGFLPTMYNLKIRHLAVNTLCPGLGFHTTSIIGIGVSISTSNKDPIWKKWSETEFVSQNTEARKISSIAYCTGLFGTISTRSIMKEYENK